MYGFPTQLYPVPQGMFEDQSAGFGAGIDRQIFYSIKDGNWSDMSIWETVSQKVGRLPTANDDVYIRHIVNADISSSVKRLFISGTLNGSNGVTVSVFEKIHSIGTIDFTNNASANISLYGTDNYINKNLFFPGTASKITYIRDGDQFIMDLSYRHLDLLGSGSKLPITDMTIAGDTTINVTLSFVGSVRFDMLSYNFTFGGNVTVNSNTSIGGIDKGQTYFAKTGPGKIIFIGKLSGNVTPGKTWDFSGNPDIEFRGGHDLIISGPGGFISGAGEWKYSTNNQTVQFGGDTFAGYNLYNKIIVDNIIVTQAGILYGANSRIMYILNELTGTTSTSKFINNGGVTYFTNASYPIMTVGIFVQNGAPGSTVGYTFDGNYTLPFNAYSNLVLGGTGVKTISSDATVSGTASGSSLSVTGNGTFGAVSLSAINILNNLIVNGNCNSGTLICTGTSVLVIGVLTALVDFSASNPTVEIRGGANIIGTGTGTGSWTFDVNNQNLTHQNSTLTFIGQVYIGAGITLFMPYSNNGFSATTFTQPVNGLDSLSTLKNEMAWNAGFGRVEYKCATRPMITGQLKCDTAMNIWKYNLSGDQDITGTTYRILEFGGSGVKKLMGNVVVNTTAGGSWSITGTATIDYNGFTITTI